MEFSKVAQLLKKNIDNLVKNQDSLFVVDVSPDSLWETYLSSYPEGTNPMFRERTEHDCSSCRRFIRSFGNVVVIQENNTVKTIWDITVKDTTYQTVFDKLNTVVLEAPVVDVYTTTVLNIGEESNRELIDDKVKTWNHFNTVLPAKFKYQGSETLDTYLSEKRSAQQVFKRALEELTLDNVNIVLELIEEKSLHRSSQYEGLLKSFKKEKEAYQALLQEQKNNYVWRQSLKAGGSLTNIRNSAIGSLLIDLDSGIELEVAVKKYEDKVSGGNYQRPKPLHTKKMREDAKKKLVDLGLENTLQRRFATIDDISVNDIIHVNSDVKDKLRDLDPFEQLARRDVIDQKKFSNVKEMGIEEFISQVVPNISKMELLLENKHQGNLVSLIAPLDRDSPSLFKWNNAFSWTYTGNITDSTMKDRVKSLGGKVDGVLRFSIQWNEENTNFSDLDAHCTEPDENHIWFGRKADHFSTGNLDVDIVTPSKNQVAVENITWSSRDKMKSGKYRFWVNCYSASRSTTGFTAEIEYDGVIHTFDYPDALRKNQDVRVATVTKHKDGTFTLAEGLKSSVRSQEMWGVVTNQFVPVSLLMNSPNYWEHEQGIGNKHYLFMLEGCTNPETPSGFFNEYLKEDLKKHRKVFEALTSLMRVKDSEHQLSGVGFNDSTRNDVTCRVTGEINTTIKIKF